MYLTHLALTNFRVFSRLDLTLPRRLLLLAGANAQGKTSLLEAVYYLATLTSVHSSSDKQLINFNALEDQVAVGRIIADFVRETKEHRLEVRLIREPNGIEGYRHRKEILLDGVKRTMTDAVGLFNAVIFLPQMTQIIEGGPEGRRRYLNLLLAQVVPGYARILTDYAQAVTQRNALLKDLSNRMGDASQLDFWDSMVAKKGAVLFSARAAAVKEMERVHGTVHEALTQGKELIRLRYLPALDLTADDEQQALFRNEPADLTNFTIAELENHFLENLARTRAEQISRGVTTIGPHRDELRFMCNGVDLGDYGSRGQVRTALMALKLAEVEWMKEKTGETPVLLLDETLAELDEHRRGELMNALHGSDQAFLTTTDVSPFSSNFVEKVAVWNVSNGYVQPAGS
ncbi:MAG TPA: DNA replication and repair protein RecF [Bellilinea sp.]|nr:DNA replication and repair protein RecF [Bellilinea sp.]